MSWRTKGAGDDDVCLIASGVANITHVSLPLACLVHGHSHHDVHFGINS